MNERVALCKAMCSFVYEHVITACVQTHVCECSVYVCLHAHGGLELMLGVLYLLMRYLFRQQLLPNPE